MGNVSLCTMITNHSNPNEQTNNQRSTWNTKFAFKTKNRTLIWNIQKRKLMQVADTQGRDALQDNTPEISDKEITYFVHFGMSSLPIIEKCLQKLVTKTAKDDTLKKTATSD